MSTTSSVSSTGTPADISTLPAAVQQALQGIKIAKNKSVLTQEDFLKLLTVQLQNQDPLKPMEDAQFMGTMAQFSALEQSKELLATVNGLSTSLSFSSAQQFLGKNVTINDAGNSVSGKVSQVQIVSGSPQLMVNGVAYTTDKVVSVSAN